MTQERTFAIRGVLETCLYAAEIGPAAIFYQQVLGLEPLSRVEGRHVFFRSGGGVFLLFDPERTAAAGGPVPPHGTRGAGHVAFAVPEGSLPDWRQHLAMRRVPLEREIEWPGGGCSIYVRDPAGNSVELATPSVWGLGSPGSRVGGP